MCQCTADGLNGFMPVVMITVGLTAIIIWKSVYIEKQSFKKKQSSSDAVRIKCMIKKLKSFKYNCNSMKRFLTYQIMKGKKATDQGNVKAAGKCFGNLAFIMGPHHGAIDLMKYSLSESTYKEVRKQRDKIENFLVNEINSD